MKNAIEITNLNKIYNLGLNKEKVAVENLHLNIAKGSIFGLLGPNGAGKSTLINILAGTVVKNSGTVNIMNCDIDKTPKLARSKIGIVPQEIVLDSFFSLSQALEFTAGYYGIRPEQRKTNQILKDLGLWDKKDAFPRQLSGGMKRRFLIAKAIAHSPSILVLDEPSAGVDIELRDQLWQYIRKLKEQGVTIIITTHYLAEAQELCDEIAFINHGKIIKQDSTQNLLNLEVKYLDVEFSQSIDQNLESKILNHFKATSHALIITQPSKLRLELGKDEKYNELFAELQSLGVQIKNIQISQTDLEDVFKKIIN